jgi:hypothetical protein
MYLGEELLYPQGAVLAARAGCLCVLKYFMQATTFISCAVALCVVQLAKHCNYQYSIAVTFLKIWPSDM